jgi:methylmalonyl-CoA/ethylmalonyl-CoA epimerase
MSGAELNRVKLPPVEQIGIVVRDLDRAIEYYTSTFGWGPFEVHSAEIKGVVYRGQPTGCKLRLAMARSGSIEIELIQVLEGETPHTEFLREKGEGLHHLRFRVDDLDGILAEWAKQGIKPVWSHRYPEFGISFAYVDTTGIGGMMIELFEVKEKPSE